MKEHLNLFRFKFVGLFLLILNLFNNLKKNLKIENIYFIIFLI